MDIKCLFCLNHLKDRELVCSADCDKQTTHYIHETCVEKMKNMQQRHCKLCDKPTQVQSIFQEFDLQRAIQIIGFPLIVQKLDEITLLLRSRNNQATKAEKEFREISEKLEKLRVERRLGMFEEELEKMKQN